jgi:thiamine pyrophosphate-dependent acetolactate synthase large subunit-like protein
MNVCEALIDILSAYNVKYIFGVPGDAINELIEAIRKQDKIRFIHVMHEEAGAFAASAQAKLTGELAVCAGTAGPGAIHLLNGLYDAKMDHAPVLAITGQVETPLEGTSYQQEVNLPSLYADVAVFNQTIHNPAQMPRLAILACQTALAERGVVHLSIPMDISREKVKDYKKLKRLAFNESVIVPNKEDLKKAASLINQSKKPCILAGIGAKHAVTELVQVAELIKAPIIKALRGKDILPDDHPLTLGGIGLLGTVPSFKAIKNCDLLLIVGSDFPYADFYPPKDVPVIQIDNRTKNIGRRHDAVIGLTGDSKVTLEELLPLLERNTDNSFLTYAQKEMAHWVKKGTSKEEERKTPIHPQMLAKTVSDLAEDNAIICCDTGAVTVWGARDFKIKGTQRFTLSGGLASMAFGLPAAIGAKLAYPGKQVIALCGDGGFAMLMADFATAVKYKLNIKVIIFNNSKLGLIQMEEEAHAGNPEYQTDLHNPDYATFAIACGGDGYTVREPEDMMFTLEKALSSDRPTIVNAFVNPEEITWPPKISREEAFNYIKAKIEEYFI